MCGGSIISGECISCGYVLPDTDKLSAPYDFDPSNVLFGEAAAADDTDEDMPSIELPDAAALPAAQIHKRTKKPAADTAQKPFVPYETPDFSAPPIYADNADIPTKIVKYVSDFLFRHWWKFLAVAVIPSVGYGFALFYFVINSDKERKKSEIFLAALMAAMTLLLQFAGWDPTGLDTIIQYIMLSFFGNGDHYY